MISDISEHSEELWQEIGAVVTAIQFQDITRQRIESAIAPLKQVANLSEEVVIRTQADSVKPKLELTKDQDEEELELADDGLFAEENILSIETHKQEKSAPQVIAPAITRDAFTVPVAGIDSKRTRANLKIQDGCDFFCSFCEIPYARGRARSREFEDILKEAQILVRAGHQELARLPTDLLTQPINHGALGRRGPGPHIVDGHRKKSVVKC